MLAPPALGYQKWNLAIIYLQIQILLNILTEYNQVCFKDKSKQAFSRLSNLDLIITFHQVWWSSSASLFLIRKNSDTPGVLTEVKTCIVQKNYFSFSTFFSQVFWVENPRFANIDTDFWNFGKVWNFDVAIILYFLN